MHDVDQCYYTSSRDTVNPLSSHLIYPLPYHHRTLKAPSGPPFNSAAAASERADICCLKKDFFFRNAPMVDYVPLFKSLMFLCILLLCISFRGNISSNLKTFLPVYEAEGIWKGWNNRTPLLSYLSFKISTHSTSIFLNIILTCFPFTAAAAAVYLYLFQPPSVILKRIDPRVYTKEEEDLKP